MMKVSGVRWPFW